MSREARILDAAGELLLTFGYRKVTVDDVARRAGVGKGTVYLHWSSKLELFATVLVREAAALTAAQLERLRSDPAEVQLHRTMRSLYLLVMRRPLARAFYAGDTELLGALSHDSKIARQVRGDEDALGPPFHAALSEPACSPTTPPRIPPSSAHSSCRRSTSSTGCQPAVPARQGDRRRPDGDGVDDAAAGRLVWWVSVGVTVLKHHLRFADSAAVAYIVPIGASLTGVFIFLLVIYTWLPNTEVSWREALPGAVVGAVVLEATFAASGQYFRLTGQLERQRAGAG